MRAPATRSGRRAAAPTISARLATRVTLEMRAGGAIAACFDGFSVGLGTFSERAVHRAQELRTGLPLAALAGAGSDVDREIERLVRRLAGRGLLEYGLRRPHGDEDFLVIEPQVPNYWPRTAELADADVLVLSRFAYLRRRGNQMVLESPRSAALFKIGDAKIAAAIASLAAPQRIKQFRRQDGFPGLQILALLVDCRILFKIETAGDSGLRASEGDNNLVLWDFQDLLFHTRSTQGRHANPLGGVYPYAGIIAPLPAVRPRWPGKKIDLRGFPSAPSPVAELLRRRHSTRSFDDRRPITLAELARFLDGTARVLSRSKIPADPAAGIPAVDYTARPYPSAGAGYELELYLAVNNCEGLPRGFYHYDAGGHALAAIGAAATELEAMLQGAQFAMGVHAAPQVLITVAARFARLSWKYSSLAYALVLRDTGVLLQTFYLMATVMELGGCAIGIADIELFAKMTGIEFHVEGPVGQFAIGRGSDSGISD